MFWTNFRRQGMFSSSDVVYDVSISWNYILLCLNDNFRLKKNGAKIERNDGKQLRAKTWPVDWRVYTWEQWVCKTIRRNRASPISSLEVARYDCLLHHFSLTSQPLKRRKLKETVIFNSRLNLLFIIFLLFLFWLLSFHECPLAENTRHLFGIFSVI